MATPLEPPGRQPISPENPAGLEVRQDEDFLTLQAEIDRLTSMSGVTGGVNWELVVQLAGQIITSKSKDLLVAAYLAVGLLETRSLAGLEPALTLLADLLENFWDQLYPPLKRLRARANALDWWREKTTAWLKKFDGPPAAAEEIKALTEAASRLAHLAEEKMPDTLPMPEILHLIHQLPADQAAATAAINSTPAPAPPEPAPPDDAAVARRDLLLAADNFLRLTGDDPWADPWRWKISRLRLWLALPGLPPADGVRTRLPAPPEEIRLALTRLLETGKYLEAIQAAEDQAELHILWLDLHYQSYCGLLALGDKYRPAALALRGEVLNLLAIWPQLASLTFEDGTPLAAPLTRKWLKDDDHEAASDITGPGEDEALEKLAEGDPLPALIRLSQAPTRPSDGRYAFRSLLKQVGLWRRLGHRPTAAGLADLLLKEIDRRRLEDWEPSLAAQALAEAYNTYQLSGQEYQPKSRDTAVRLARLDPEAALSLRPVSE